MKFIKYTLNIILLTIFFRLLAEADQIPYKDNFGDILLLILSFAMMFGLRLLVGQKTKELE